MADERELLRESYPRILANERALANQLDKLRGLTAHEERQAAASVREPVSALESIGDDQGLALKTIVKRVGRPVLEVTNNDYIIDGPESIIWEARLGNNTVRALLSHVIPSVGRIKVDNDPNLTWVDTGRLIVDNIIDRSSRHLRIRRPEHQILRPIVRVQARLARPNQNGRPRRFCRELRKNDSRAFAVKQVLHIEDEDRPDFAFLPIGQTATDGPRRQPLNRRTTGLQTSSTLPRSAIRQTTAFRHCPKDAFLGNVAHLDFLLSRSWVAFAKRSTTSRLLSDLA